MSANFATPPEFPTCAGVEGLLFDFNYGARVHLPEGKWHVILWMMKAAIFFSAVILTEDGSQ